MLVNIEKTNAIDKVKILKEISQEKYIYMTELIDNPIDLLTTHKKILSCIEMGVDIPVSLIRNYQKQGIQEQNKELLEILEETLEKWGVYFKSEKAKSNLYVKIEELLTKYNHLNQKP